jgi:acyl-CoA dehydrogenase
MDFAFSAKVKDLQQRLQAFMDEYVHPGEQRFYDEIERNRWTPTSITSTN